MSRSEMTARVVSLASAEAGDSRMGGTAEDRLEALVQLTAEAWRLSGCALPTYSRATMPVTLSTVAEQGRDDFPRPRQRRDR